MTRIAQLSLTSFDEEIHGAPSQVIIVLLFCVQHTGRTTSYHIGKKTALFSVSSWRFVGPYHDHLAYNQSHERCIECRTMHQASMCKRTAQVLRLPLRTVVLMHASH